MDTSIEAFRCISYQCGTENPKQFLLLRVLCLMPHATKAEADLTLTLSWLYEQTEGYR